MSNKQDTKGMKPIAQRKLVPQLRFPEFRDAGKWNVFWGCDLFAQISNKQHDSSLPVLAITQEYGAIPRNEIDYQVSVSEKSLENYKVVEVGDFIISLRSFQGGIEYSRYNGICSPAYVILRMKFAGSEQYFKQFFKTSKFIQQLNKNIEGLRDGKMVGYKQFSELLLPIPSVSEQEKIAECLASIDDRITLETQKLDTLKAHKKGLMQQLFPAEGQTLPQLRFPEFCDAGEWEEKELGEISHKIMVGIASAATHAYRKSGVILFRNQNIKEGYLDDNDILFIDEDYEKSYKNKRLKAGDLLTARTGYPGTTCVVSTNHEGSQSFTTLITRPNNSIINSSYLCIFINSEKGQTFFNSTKIGGGQKNVNAGSLTVMPILYPSHQEQEKISDCISSLDELIALQAQKINVLKLHKKGLMQQLFPSVDEVSE